MGKPSDRPPSDLPSNEQIKLQSRYLDVRGESMAMNDEHLTPETKELIRQQAHDSLHKDGWIQYESDSQEEVPGVVRAVVSILTLGLF